MSKEQEQKIYEAGLLALADTSKKAFIEGYRAAADQSSDVDPDFAEAYWLNSDVCKAITKVVEEYAGRKL